MVTEGFVDPYTKEPLLPDSDGNLRRQNNGKSVIYPIVDSCYDFVIPDPTLKNEREHYDKEHTKIAPTELNLQLVQRPWFDESEPWWLTFLESLGDVFGKRILLIGNGCSCRELLFVHLGALVVYTDLSFEAVKAVCEAFRHSEMSRSSKGLIEFHAVDAMHLPFPDRSFDIIYGSGFVHHLEDMAPFFTEVYRCLKSNGICRFFDQADSPLWDGLKRTVLRPLQLYSYWKHPRSPEDLKANFRGGFNRERLTDAMRRHNFRSLFFVREWFFHAIVWRHFGKAVDWKPDAMRKATPLFRLLKRIDNFFSKTHWMQENQLMLIWGFDK